MSSLLFEAGWPVFNQWTFISNLGIVLDEDSLALCIVRSTWTLGIW